MNTKPIALVTCYFQPNFGSQLQAYATQMAFEKLGVENETITIDGLKPEINKAKYRYFLGKLFDINIVKDKMATVRKIVAKQRNPEYSKNLAIRYRFFDDFAQKKFKLSKRYNSKKELGDAANDYSAFVLGSDQLWLPSNIAADYYTLNFVPNNVPKITLATSFGITKLPPPYGLKAKMFLNRIDYISVREKSGQSLVKQWADRDVPVVCDPTIMFYSEEWEKALDAYGDGKRFAEGKKYLFVYFLGNNPWERDMVKNVSRETGLKIVQLAHSDEYIRSDEGFADYTPYNVGPKEFIELIRDADYVFTDSFHCSVFSMLNHKNFFTFPRYNNEGPTSTNGRLYSLLSLVRHENRLIRKGRTIELNAAMDYSVIDAELDSLRQFTWNWLTEALKKCGVI